MDAPNVTEDLAVLLGRMESAIELKQEQVAELRGQIGRMRDKVRRAHRLLLAHEHASPSPGYPIAALELLREALDEGKP